MAPSAPTSAASAAIGRATGAHGKARAATPAASSTTSSCTPARSATNAASPSSASARDFTAVRPSCQQRLRDDRDDDRRDAVQARRRPAGSVP